MGPYQTTGVILMAMAQGVPRLPSLNNCVIRYCALQHHLAMEILVPITIVTQGLSVQFFQKGSFKNVCLLKKQLMNLCLELS